FYFTRAVLPHMRKKGYGRIINPSSDSIQIAPPGMSAYVTAKDGIVEFTQVTAFEARSGITANVILPGLTVTETSWRASL
ncbi:NAD(P)-binding protein, partial [Pyrenochaeta sp. DS3sAY3a]